MFQEFRLNWQSGTFGWVEVYSCIKLGLFFDQNY